MAKYALINSSGIVERVIEATPETIARNGHAPGRFKDIYVAAVRIYTRNEAPHPDAIDGTNAEPGARFDPATKTFSREDVVALPDELEQRVLDIIAKNSGGAGGVGSRKI